MRVLMAWWCASWMNMSAVSLATNRLLKQCTNNTMVNIHCDTSNNVKWFFEIGLNGLAQVNQFLMKNTKRQVVDASGSFSSWCERALKIAY
jgi:hypothetical protein